MKKPVKILQASAGSGKTFSLAVHYLTLLFSDDNKYKEILAVTFTNKATEEMKTRILEVLKGLAENDEKATKGYQDLILKEYPQLNKELLKIKADKIYRKILHDYSRFSVSTIDGFVQKVIRGFAFELGLDSGFGLEMNLDKVKEELVIRLDNQLSKNPALLDWVIQLTFNRIEEGKSWNYKSQLEELTGEIFKEKFGVFENALANYTEEQLTEIFETLIAYTTEVISIYNNNLKEKAVAALNIINQEGLSTDDFNGKSRSPLVKLEKIKEGNLEKLEKFFELLDKPEDKWFKKGLSNNLVYQEVSKIIAQIKDFIVTEGPQVELALAFKKNIYYLRLMQEIAHLLKVYREENDNLIINDAQKLLNQITTDLDGNPSFLWEKIGSRYKNFLFDEFQDTSTSQWNSFKSLVQNAIAEPSEEFIDHLIVGDTKQSIYRWRNGDWKILHEQAKHNLLEENIVESSLEENYRSTTNIINFNNKLYKALPSIIQRELNSAIPLENNEITEWWNKNNYNTIVEDIYKGATQNTHAKTTNGGTLIIKKFLKEDEEGEDEKTTTFNNSDFKEKALKSVIAEIKKLTEEYAYEYKDISILVRNNADALLAVNALMNEQIKVVSGDALLLCNNTAIKLIINALKAIVGTTANSALYKANCIALYAKITDKKDPDPKKYLNLSNKKLENLQDILPLDFATASHNWLQLPMPEMVEKIIKSFGLDNIPDFLPYLLAFRDITANASKQGEKGIHSFLKWWDEDGSRKALPSPETADAVQIITIHKSKGLAFRAVFVPFCDWDLNGKANSIFWVNAEKTSYKLLGNIPLRYSKTLATTSIADAYYEEKLYSYMDALNMLYVATTRSKDYLYIGVKGGKKSEDITNVGDLIIHNFEQEFDENNIYKVEDYIVKKSKINEAENNIVAKITLNKYPTTNRLAEIFEPNEERHPNHLLNIENNGREGSILHDILATIENPDFLENKIDDLIEEGIIYSEEKAAFIKNAKEVLEHPELNEILNNTDEILSEKSIIDSKGKMHRPDKVLKQGNQIIILDYKFTLQESKSHYEQINRYKELFFSMGHKDVKAFLFYAITKQLKAI